MFEQSGIDLDKAGSAGKLVLDYLAEKKSLKDLYEHPPAIKGFKALLAENPSVYVNREVLCNSLNTQAASVSNTHAASKNNIELLKSEKTFTVTTGHQLCLFTGPLYFIYKIASTINLAKRLKKEFGEYDFVPVYWMASEDHDLEEVNHFNLFNRKISWKTEQQGAVGDLATEGLALLLPELREALGLSDHAPALMQLFTDSYLENKNLATATRYLVNQLFGEKGLVIVDGNDAALKGLFREEFKKDLFESLTSVQMQPTINNLEKAGYKIQVKPRDVNVFLLDKGKRLRLDRSNDLYQAAGEKTFTRLGLEQLINTQPERLSPNVSLRPLYQQKILPNLAYVGGPGELAYWLEYRAMFKAYNLQFPILVPRNFITVLEPAASAKIKRAGINKQELFRDEATLIKIVQEKEGTMFSLQNEKEQLSEIYQKLTNKAQQADTSLEKHVLALQQKHLSNISALEKKMNRAGKKKIDTEIKRVIEARQLIFPGGQPQDRFLNFSSLYLLYGRKFFDLIFEHADPFLQKHIILEDH